MAPISLAPVDYLPALPAKKDVGIGCVGAGFIMDECHLPAYRASGFCPLAIVSRNPERAQAVADRHELPGCYPTVGQMLDDDRIEVLDIAVPPDILIDVVREACDHRRKVRGILAQKPMGCNLDQAVEIVRRCEQAGITLVVNQNMRYDQSIRAMKSLLNQNALGEPVLATIDMRAIPHWMPWQRRLGWVTLRIMSIHHLDTLRFWFGNPERVYASIRSDPRTSTKFEHADGICLYVLEYASGLRASGWDDVWSGPAREGAAADIGIRWRIEGTTGLARGTIGWPSYPQRTPSTLDYSTTEDAGHWRQPRWNDVWFPDAFAGPMGELLIALETGAPASLAGNDNLWTMALVEACYVSAAEKRAIGPGELLQMSMDGKLK